MAREASASSVEMNERDKSKRIGALSGLWPFMRPYRLWLLAAFAALTFTAGISLVLPLAVRRVIDGFDGATNQLLDKYFLAALVVASLLGGWYRPQVLFGDTSGRTDRCRHSKSRLRAGDRHEPYVF